MQHGPSINDNVSTRSYLHETAYRKRREERVSYLRRHFMAIGHAEQRTDHGPGSRSLSRESSRAKI